MKIIKKTLKWIVVAFFASTILSVVALRFMPVVVTPLMLIRCYEQVKAGEELKLSHDWEPLTNISKDLPIAVMASEDAKFLDHHGFDYQAIEHAAKRNRQHPEKRKLGASTISQQTAKNVFLWPGRSWVRKGFEVYFTAGVSELHRDGQRHLWCPSGGGGTLQYRCQGLDESPVRPDCRHTA